MRRPVLALLLLLARPASADDTCPVAPRNGSWDALLGKVPRPGSEEAVADLAVVLWEQRIRTREEVARAAAEEELSLEDFAAVLGPGVDPAAHPLTEKLLVRAAAAARPCLYAAKAALARPRPYVADSRVSPTAER